jgi:putative transposase
VVVSFTCEVGIVPERHARPGPAVGIDLGLKTLLTVVDDHGSVITMDGVHIFATGVA